MNTGIKRKLTVGYKNVFAEKPKTVEEYLKGISRPQLLNIASFFLGFLNRKSSYDKPDRLLNMFFSRENDVIAAQIHASLKSFERETNADLIIINKQSSLQLFEFCFDNLIKGETQSRAEAELNVFKTYLIFNQENSIKEKIAGNTTEDLGSLRLAGLFMAQSYAYSDIENYNLIELTITQLIKATFLFEFLESNKNTGPHLQELLQFYSCSNWKEYLMRLLPLIFSIHKAENEAHLDIVVEQDSHFQENCNFLEQLVISETDILTDVDFRRIRSNPMYKVSEGVYRIIFNLFVIEKLYKGLYFKLNEINQTLPTELKISNFRSFYTNKFSEQYMLYRILQCIYQNRYIKFTGAAISENGVKAEPDYYIRNGNKMFLFESKDILINAMVKTSYDFKIIEGEFKKKLYHEEEKNKAVLQLIYNIRRALRKQLPFDTMYKEKSIYIYPILILHDRQFNLAGLNVLLNSWFQEELKKLEQEGLVVKKVRPITIIDIDTFILHQDVLRDRTIKLENIIESYFEHVTLQEKKKYVGQTHAYQHVERTVTPFSIFLSNYLAHKNIHTVPSMLTDKGLSLFNG